jgi:hypothetical protein
VVLWPARQKGDCEMINHDPFAGASNRARWMIGLPLKVRTRTPKRTKPDLVKLFGLSPAELEQADPGSRSTASR